jgi:hypothetical protein
MQELKVEGKVFERLRKEIERQTEKKCENCKFGNIRNECCERFKIGIPNLTCFKQKPIQLTENFQKENSSKEIQRISIVLHEDVLKCQDYKHNQYNTCELNKTLPCNYVCVDGCIQLEVGI